MDMQDMLDSLGWQDNKFESRSQLPVELPVKCQENLAKETENQKPTTSEIKLQVSEDKTVESRKCLEDIIPMDVDQEGTLVQPEPLPEPFKVKKMSGRPSKSFLQNLKPTRGSQRKKSCPNTMQIVEKQNRCLWSSEDKKTLLQALEEVGPDNIKGIQTYLPHKQENNIRSQIRMWKEFARLDLQKKLVSDKKRMDNAIVNCVSKLDDWIEHFEGIAAMSPAKQFALANVFLLISEYAEFPPPEECSGIDFRAMYRYIHCLLNSKPFYGVNGQTARLLNENVSHMFSLIREYNRVSGMVDHLYQVEPQERKPHIKNYGRAANRVRKNISPLLNPEAVLHISQMNPLNIPRHAFVKPAVEEDDDDSDWSDVDDGP